MGDAHVFLEALAIVLGVAAITTVVFQRLRQPVVLGYIIAGVIVGPHVPIPLVADVNVVQTLSEFGVILFMFCLGLEFSLRRMLSVGPIAGIAAVIETSLMLWLGFVTARALGWSERECIYAGAIVAISSTTIVVKSLAELGVSGRVRDLAVGILIFEDLIAVLLITLLASVPASGTISPEVLGRAGLRLSAFLVGMVALGLLVVPRAVRAVFRLQRKETTLVASVGICFAFALFAHGLGYSVALGAFLAGSLVGESGHQEEIEELVGPIRDMFTAVFFVSVGMMIDPKSIASNLPAVLLFTVVVLVGKTVGVSLGGFLGGNGIRTSVRGAMSLSQIGEFSFIIAGVGLARGAVGDFVYSVAVAVSVVTAFTTPYLIRASEPTAAFIDRKLPHALQTFAALYGSWIERLRNRSDERSGSEIRRCARLLLVDAAAIVAIVITASLSHAHLAVILASSTGFGRLVVDSSFFAAALVLGLPFGVGIARLARRLGVLLAEAALPRAGNTRFDPADAPRRAFVVALQLGTVFLVGVPMVAITQPFLPWASGALLLALAVAVLGFAFWRSATNLEGHVRAGAEMVLAVIAAQAGSGGGKRGPRALEEVEELLPGMGVPTAFRLPLRSPAVGRTLAGLNLRGSTGATVLAITREEGGVSVPGPTEILRAGDTLALAGTRASIEQAVILLSKGTLS